MEICEKCIMPNSYPNITFDKGVCSFCRSYSPGKTAAPGKDKLLEILNSVEKTSEYDCLVPVSGGKDSSYALYYVVRELGLRPLAVYWDFDYATDIGKNNIKRLCEKLSVDLVIGKSKNNFRRKAVNEGLYIGRYTGDFFRICGNCINNVHTFVINEATRRKIPFIIWGATDYEDVPTKVGSFQSETFRKWYGSNIGFIKSTFKRSLWLLGSGMTLGGKCKAIWHFLKHYYYIVRDNIDTEAPEGWKKFNPLLRVSFENKKVKTIYLYDYVEYDIYKYIEVLQKETGWEAIAGREMRMDCRLHFVINYQHFKETGLTIDGFALATLVRRGLLSRREAMEKEEVVREYSEIESQKVLEELGFHGKTLTSN